MKSLHAQNAFSQQVPIERFQMSEIKIDSVSFRNGTLVDPVGPDHVKNLVRSNSSFGQALEQPVSNFDVLLRDGHGCLQSHLDAFRDSVFVPACWNTPTLEINIVGYSARTYNEACAGIIDESRHFVRSTHPINIPQP